MQSSSPRVWKVEENVPRVKRWLKVKVYPGPRTRGVGGIERGSNGIMQIAICILTSPFRWHPAGGTSLRRVSCRGWPSSRTPVSPRPPPRTPLLAYIFLFHKLKLNIETQGREWVGIQGGRSRNKKPISEGNQAWFPYFILFHFILFLYIFFHPFSLFLSFFLTATFGRNSGSYGKNGREAKLRIK